MSAYPRRAAALSMADPWSVTCKSSLASANVNVNISVSVSVTASVQVVTLQCYFASN